MNREAEQAVLRTVFNQVREGRGSVVFVSGEAGVGKTRLVREFGQFAESSGAIFLEGSSYEHEDFIPYSPWMDALRALLKRTTNETLRHVQGWVVGEIGRLVPTVIARAEEIGLKGWLQGPKSSLVIAPSTDQERVRLFQAVLDFLGNLSDKHPIVIFLDDIGWADSASLQLFHYVARRVSEQKVLMIAAYREAGLPEDHALTKMRLNLVRQKIAREIPLSRFAQDHVLDLLGANLKGAISKELGHLVYKRTGGNPFFVEEITLSLADGGHLERTSQGWSLRATEHLQIPTSVMAIIRQRISNLGEDCIQFLSLASLIGMEFDFDVLKKAASIPEDLSMRLLETAVRCQLVRERRDGRRAVYAFADEQVRSFLSEQVSLVRSRKYHDSIGHALEESYGQTLEDHLGEIAYHYLQAADVSKAREYCIRAGERSEQLHAYSDARTQFTSALELTGEGELESRLDLLTRLARGAWARGNHGEVVQFGDMAIEVAEKLSAQEKLAYLYGLIGVSYLIFGNSPPAALESLHKGLQALEGSGDSPQEAFLCSQLARVYSLTGQPEQAKKWVDRAIQMSTKLGAYEALSHAYQTLAVGLPVKEKESIIQYYEKALHLALDHGLEESALRAYNNLSYAYAELNGDYKRAKGLLLKGIERARSAGYVDSEIFMRGHLAQRQMDLGEWDISEREASELLSVSSELGEKMLLHPYSVLGYIALARGDLEKAEKILEEAFPVAIRSGWTEELGQWNCFAGELHLAKNDLQESEKYLLSALEHSKQSAWGPTLVNVLFELVKLNLRRKDLDHASTYCQELQGRAKEVDEKSALGLGNWAMGLLAEAKGEVANGMEALRVCINSFRTAELPYYLGLALVDLGRLQGKAGNMEEAKACLQESEKIFSHLGIASLPRLR